MVAELRLFLVQKKIYPLLNMLVAVGSAQASSMKINLWYQILWKQWVEYCSDFNFLSATPISLYCQELYSINCKINLKLNYLQISFKAFERSTNVL